MKVIRCIACSPSLDWEELGIATRHVQRAHRDLVRGLDGYELAFAIRGALKTVEIDRLPASSDGA